MTRLHKQIFAKLSLFGSEANPQNGREAREGGVKTFLWFLPSASKTLNVEFFFSRSCNGTICNINVFCFRTNGLCFVNS